MSSLADLPELVGFFSYSREDDADSHGALSALRNRIQGELRGQLGRTAKTFRLWQDKEAIPSGTLWETEIKNAVGQAAFFIPIITPTVVASPYCRFELEAFLAREAELGRDDLVFPILYIDVPALEDSVRRQNDPVLSLIAKRQYVDWRKLRHRDAWMTDASEAVERFCRHIRDALAKHWLSPEERKQQEEAAALERAEAERERRATDAKRRAEEEARQRTVEQQRRQREAEEEQNRIAALEARARADEQRRKREEEAEQRRAEERRLREEAEAKRRAAVEERRRQRGSQARALWPPSRPVLVAGSLCGVVLLGAIGAWLALLPTHVRVVPTPVVSPTPAPVTPAPAPARPASVAPLPPPPVTHIDQLRFDGTYQGDYMSDIYEYFRFYPDGKVIYFWQRHNQSESFSNEPNPTATSFPEGNSNLISSYQISGTEIKMSIPFPQGANDFDGTITDVGLSLHWFSHINGASGNRQYRFIPFSP